MAEPLADRVTRSIEQSAELYHRLTLVVGPAGSGKTRALCEVQRRMGAPRVNLNLELSRQMLELTIRQRALQLPRLMNEIVDQAGHDVILLDNVEILFDVNLKQDPLRLLQGIARNRTVVAAWNGAVENGQVSYATPEHPEYRRYPVHDFLVATADVNG